MDPQPPSAHRPEHSQLSQRSQYSTLHMEVIDVGEGEIKEEEEEEEEEKERK